MSVSGEYNTTSSGDDGELSELDVEFIQMQAEMGDYDNGDDMNRATHVIEMVLENIHAQLDATDIPHVVSTDPKREAEYAIEFMGKLLDSRIDEKRYSKDGLQPQDAQIIAIDCYKAYFEQWEAESLLVVYALQSIHHRLSTSEADERMAVVNYMRDRCRAQLQVLYKLDDKWLKFFDNVTGTEPSFYNAQQVDLASSIEESSLAEFTEARQTRWDIVDAAVDKAGVSYKNDDIAMVLMVIEFATLLQLRAAATVHSEQQRSERNENMWDYARHAGPRAGLAVAAIKRVIDFYDLMYPIEP